MGRWRSVYTAADAPSQYPTPKHPALQVLSPAYSPQSLPQKGKERKENVKVYLHFSPYSGLLPQHCFCGTSRSRIGILLRASIYYFAHRYIASRFGILLCGTSPTFSHFVDLSPSPLFTLSKEMSPACFPLPHHRSPSIPLISKQGESIARPLRAASHLLWRITERRSDLGSQVLQLLYAAPVIFFLRSNMGAAM